MVRTQVQFDERQYERIRHIAGIKRVSISEVVRRLVTRGLEGADPGDRVGADVLLDLAGIANGPSDLGANHDAWLEKEEP